MTEPDEGTPPNLSTLGVLLRFSPMVYGPTTLFALGIGVTVPLVPVIATDLGANLSLAALVSAALVIGQALANLPTGVIVVKLGERLTMVYAGLLGLLGAIGMLLATSLPLFALSVFVLGVSAAAFGVARHAFMTLRVPVQYRARALSLLGGTYRLGMFIGPFLAAFLIALTGSDRSAVWGLIVSLSITILLVLFGKDPETALAAYLPTTETTQSIPVVGSNGLLATVSRHRKVLSRLGAAAATLSLVRSAREVLLPLWGLLIGLDSQTIVTVIGIAGAIDFALFYASGQLMDRFGRLIAAVPAMAIMSAAFLMLSFTVPFEHAQWWFVAMALVIGLGNGLSSGILLTLGSDLAPRRDPSTFLGAWRTLTDGGGALAPVLIAGIAGIASLPIASAAVGILGTAGMLGFLRWIPRYIPTHRKDRSG